MTTDRDIPAYGPFKDAKPYGPGAPSARRGEAIAEIEALSRHFTEQREQLLAKHRAEEAAEARRQEAANVAAAEAQRRLDEQMAPIRAQRRREYFVAHPSGTDAEFERLWGRLREDEVTAYREQQIEQTAEALRRSGRYDGIL